MSGSGSEKAKQNEDGYTNAFWSIIQPYTAGGKYAMGSVTYVAIETLVGQAVRKIMKSPTTWRDSIVTHAISVPFLGQLNFGEPYDPLNIDPDGKVELMDEAVNGAKAIPAAIVGYTAMRLMYDGFKIPAYANRDFLYMCIGKVLSRPLTAYMASSLPEDIQIGLQVLNSLANRQQTVIKSEKDAKKLRAKK